MTDATEHPKYDANSCTPKNVNIILVVVLTYVEQKLRDIPDIVACKHNWSHYCVTLKLQFNETCVVFDGFYVNLLTLSPQPNQIPSRKHNIAFDISFMGQKMNWIA